MRNKKLIPFEVIEKAVAGEPEAVEAVLRHYTAHIKYLSMYKGHIYSLFLVALCLSALVISCCKYFLINVNSKLYGRCKGERQRRRQKCFLRCLSLCSKIKSHIRQAKTSLLQCRRGR